nr:MAG: hypothetical protein J07AB56_08600 [Candidatus Nanosalinarum sp. J07AB56]
MDKTKAPIEDEGDKETDEKIYMVIAGLFFVTPTIQTAQEGMSILAGLQYLLAASWMGLALLKADRGRKIRISALLVSGLGTWLFLRNAI